MRAARSTGRPRCAVVSLCLCACAAAFISACVEDEASRRERGARFEAWTDETVDRALEKYHYPERWIDREAIRARARAHWEQGVSDDRIGERMDLEVRAGLTSFADPDAKHGIGLRYALPFDCRIPRPVAQGYGGEESHLNPTSFHAFDFTLPLGTPVLAAREGVVARVLDGFTGPGPNWSGNTVLIEHSDGTFAVYTHLSPGIPVAEGDEVERGQQIASSGDTGATTGPHLHFSVNQGQPDQGLHSVRIRFGSAGEKGVLPQRAELIGCSVGPPTVRLRAFVASRPHDESQMFPLRKGASARIRVEVIRSSGEVVDVTDHPKTVFANMTLDDLDLREGGLVVAEPSPGFGVEGEASGLGWVRVIYGYPGDDEVGTLDLGFSIGDGAR